MGNLRRPYGSKTSVSSLANSAQHAPRPSRIVLHDFCVFFDFYPNKYPFFYMGHGNIPGLQRKKNLSSLPFITQQALEVENRQVLTACKQAICISKAITTAPYPYLTVCHGFSLEVQRGC